MGPLRMGYVLSLVLFIFLAACTAAPSRLEAQDKDIDDRIKSKESELRKLRKDIADQRKKIKNVEKRERDVAEYLVKLEREEQLTRKLLDGLAEKEGMLEEQVRNLREALANNEEIYRHRLTVLSRRLREMYKNGPRHVWQEAFGATDFADLLQRYKFATLVAEQDAALVADMKRKRAEIERQEAGITEILHEVGVSRREKEEELERLAENERKRKSTLTKLQKRKRQYRKKIEELAAAEKNLLGFIEELEKRRLEQAKAWEEYGERDFLGLKGKLKMPVEGNTVRAFGRFKHPEFGTVTFNTGIDIEVRPSSPVRAVVRGRVEYASTLPGYGNCIILNHGGGYYTLYAHTSRIFVKQGDLVETGKVIAEAGESGADEGDVLHFEIRKSKKALDPGEWLER